MKKVSKMGAPSAWGKRVAALAWPCLLLTQNLLISPTFAVSPSSMNPAYTTANLLPAGFKPEVTGMDSLSNGTLVLSTRVDDPYVYAPETSGKIYLVTGHKNYSSTGVTYKIIAEGLFEPMGVAVVRDTIYTVTRRELIRFVDANRDGIYELKTTVCTGWPYGGSDNGPGGPFNNFNTDDIFEWSFGLIYKDGSFYTHLSSHSSTDDYQSTDRGSLIKMQTNNTFEILNGGIRRSNGIGLGPYNEIFVTDNQGEWVPTNRLIHSQKGKWFGYVNGPDANKTQQFAPAKTAIWMESYAVARSPSQPSLLIQGPYRGQMITGDCTDPNIRRMFLEKVNNEYQGAVFHFGAMNNAPANRFLMRPNGDVFVGGLGSFTQGHSDWNWGGGVMYGLQVLRPTGVTPFDILAVRAVRGGFDIEFTKPVGTGADNGNNFEVKTWNYISERRYDSQKQNEYQMWPSYTRVSEDKKRVFLAIDNLPVGNVVYIRVKPEIKSQSNENLWVSEAWYTLNNLGTVEPLQATPEVWLPAPVYKRGQASAMGEYFRYQAGSRMLSFGPGVKTAVSVVISDLQGRKIAEVSRKEPTGSIHLPAGKFPSGIYLVSIKSQKFMQESRVAIY